MSEFGAIILSFVLIIAALLILGTGFFAGYKQGREDLLREIARDSRGEGE